MKMLSVIIPVYNAKRTLARCLLSVVRAVSVPYEIICVDDGSDDNSGHIVKSFSKIFPSIKLIRLDQNEGLFQARLEGIKAARGLYIGFVDADDVVCRGYFDLLYKAATDKNTDIAVGQIVNCTRGGYRYLQSRCAFFPYTDEKSDIETLYWAQAGASYHWHVVWNKIYKGEILRHSIPLLEKFSGHHVMLEDFVFSSVWFSAVTSYVTVPEARYTYMDNDTASTSESRWEELDKSVEDIKEAFEFVKEFLKNTGKYERYEDYCFLWHQRYGRIWYAKISKLNIAAREKEALLEKVRRYFGDGVDRKDNSDEYYYELAEPVDNWIISRLRQLKRLG